VKPVGEPDAGDRHVRFDERGWETGRCRMAQATAPILDSTDSDLPGQSANWPVSGEERKSTNPRRTISIYEYMPERPRWSSSFFCRTSRANLINKISLARRAQSVSHHGQLGPRRPAPGMVVNPHKLPIAMGEPLLLVMRVQRPKVGLEVLKTADERRGEHHRHARASSLVCRAGRRRFREEQSSAARVNTNGLTRPMGAPTRMCDGTYTQGPGHSISPRGQSYAPNMPQDTNSS